MLSFPEPEVAATPLRFWDDKAFWVAGLLAIFAILFGTRHIDATERLEGMVVAVAFESVIKLLAFLAAGFFVTFMLFDGPRALFEQAAEVDQIRDLMLLSSLPGGYVNWLSLTLLSMLAIIFLPRQWQVTVVENVNEDHLRTAAWLFPLYLLVINLFVLPIAFAGMLYFSEGTVNPDSFVLALPLAEGITGWPCLSTSAVSRRPPAWSSWPLSPCRSWSATTWWYRRSCACGVFACPPTPISRASSSTCAAGSSA